MKSDIIPVVFATDNNYVPYCGVAVSSMIANTCKNNNYEIYILYDKLSALSIYKLESLGISNAPVKCLCIHEYIKDLDILEHGHLSVATTYRLIIPDVLPQFDKVIYLDSDIVVNDDISKLFEIDIGDNILGAAHGYYVNIYKHITVTLGLDVSSFFNAGILIINRPEFIKNSIKEKCFKLLIERDDLIYMDQCALNITCVNKIYYFDNSWNYEWLYIVDDESMICNKKDISIVHFDGTDKPWTFPEYPLADIFWKYARNTIFYEEIVKRMSGKVFQKYTSLFNLISDVKKIAVYGAGVYGKKLVEKISDLNIFEIAAWVDVNYKDKKDLPLPVYPVEKLYDTDFDIVIIAMYDDAVAETIKETLVANGVDSNKIRRYK